MRYLTGITNNRTTGNKKEEPSITVHLSLNNHILAIHQNTNKCKRTKSRTRKEKKNGFSDDDTSESWDLAMSTRILAAGWTMSRSFMMVAPSLEMVVLPLSSWISLSIPLGPSVVRTVSATTVHALMLLTSCALPCDVSVPSFNRMIWGCCCYTHTQTYQRIRYINVKQKR